MNRLLPATVQEALGSLGDTSHQSALLDGLRVGRASWPSHLNPYRLPKAAGFRNAWALGWRLGQRGGRP